MIVGIDVGGTHTDGVLLKNGRLSHNCKIETDKSHLAETINHCLTKLLSASHPSQIQKIVISSTLCTNVILENKMDPVGLLLVPGPGRRIKWNEKFHQVAVFEGAIDHRGKVTQPLPEQPILNKLQSFRDAGITNFAVVSKFSIRNAVFENQLSETILQQNPDCLVTQGHQLSGQLNFPRRVASAYLNSAVKRVQTDFIHSLKHAFQEHKLSCPFYFLKADGGMMNLAAAEFLPVQTIHSGPAAGVMGIWAQETENRCAVTLDVGGTTTDIGLLINNAPTFEPQGVSISNYKTLVRGIYTHSVPVGSDSVVTVRDKELMILPERRDNAAAFGGKHATPTDALVVSGAMKSGNAHRATEALLPLAEQLDISVADFARLVITQFSQKIRQAIEQLLNAVNGQPIYTIYELLEWEDYNPDKIILVGGASTALKGVFDQVWDIPVVIPEVHSVTNAYGAAVSRMTLTQTGHADTSRGILILAEQGIRKKIPHSFTPEELKTEVLYQLIESARENGIPAAEQQNYEIVDFSEFNMVEGAFRTGKLIDIIAQIKPGISSDACHPNE